MQTSYFPYGLPMHGLSSNPQYNRLMYNGNELQTDHALNIYDFNARQQDPQTGRFWAIDPLAESYADISPYTFCAGDPINSADPTGCYVEGWVGEQTGVGVFGEHDSGNAGLGGGVGRIIPRYDASAWFCKLKDAVNRNEDISQYAKQLGAILIYSNTALGVYFNQKEALANNVMLDLGRCTINNDGSVGSPKDGGNGNAYHLYFGGATKFSPIVVSDQQMTSSSLTQPLIQSSDLNDGINGLGSVWSYSESLSETKALTNAGKAASRLIGSTGAVIGIVGTGIGIYETLSKPNTGYGDYTKMGVDVALTALSTALYFTGAGTPIALLITTVQLANNLGTFDYFYEQINYSTKK